MPVASPDEASAKPPRRESIEELFAALESPLLHYGLRLLRDHGAAEDVVQEAFMKLHAQFEKIQEPRRWLYRTVHNLALNHQRRASRIVPFDSPAGTDAPAEASTPDPLPLPDDQIARWEGIGLVRLGLETLDARSREIIRLKFNEDLSYKEIGVHTGLKPGHVGYLLHHALKAIAAELAKTGVLP
jgi:RNA polymerase sigma-70 factor (ECF subfamily)